MSTPQCSRHTSRHTTTFPLGSSRHFGHLHDTFRDSSQLLHCTPDAIHISRNRVSLPPTPFHLKIEEGKIWFGLIFQVLTALISGVGYGLPFVSSLSDEPCLPSFNTEPSPSSKARYLSHWCGSLKRGERREPMESWSKQPMITPTWDIHLYLALSNCYPVPPSANWKIWETATPIFPHPAGCSTNHNIPSWFELPSKEDPYQGQQSWPNAC